MNKKIPDWIKIFLKKPHSMEIHTMIVVAKLKARQESFENMKAAYDETKRKES
jgi:hypothetical protein